MKPIIFALPFLLSSASLHAESFKIDPSHSSVSFSVRHLVSQVTGRFTITAGNFTYQEGKSSSWSAEADLDPASIDTGIEKRDSHLRNPDFMDVERCKTMSFKSTEVRDFEEGKGKLHGVLTMHCAEKPVALDLVFHGVAEDPWGNKRAGATATGVLNRKDWDIDYNMPLKTGKLLLGEEVKVTIEIEGIAKTKPSEKKSSKKNSSKD